MNEDFFDVLEKSGCLKDEKISSNNDFEIDSKAAEFFNFCPEKSGCKEKYGRFWERTKPIDTNKWYMGVSGNGNSDKVSYSTTERNKKIYVAIWT